MQSSIRPQKGDGKGRGSWDPRGQHPPNLLTPCLLCSLPSPTCPISTQRSAPCKAAGIYAYTHTSPRYSERPVHARGHTQLGMTADTQLLLPSLCRLPFTPDLFSASPNGPQLPWEAEVTQAAGWLRPAKTRLADTICSPPFIQRVEMER